MTENIEGLKKSLTIKTIFVSLAIFWTLFIIITGIVIVKWEKEKGDGITLSQLRSYFQMVVMTRFWNAQKGGVYVHVNEKNQPNPYLKVPHRDVTTQDGQKLTLINPAYMTRQLADIASVRKNVRFRITSLNPIRPENRPEEWEKQALLKFVKADTEYFSLMKDDNGRTIYRYMAPLWTEKPCLKCHAEQGYKLNDLRGGISVTLPGETILYYRNSTIYKLLATISAIYFIGLGGIKFFYRKAHREFQERIHLIEELQNAFQEIKTLKGFIPICASCKKIRNDAGYWEQVEEYISAHSEAVFSHGLCPDCLKKLYPEYGDKLEENDKDK